MNKYPLTYRVRQLAWGGVDLLFPPVCGGCGRNGKRWCENCQSRVPIISNNFCQSCGIPTENGGICEKCKSEPPSYREMRSWAVFDSPIQEALHTLKYRRNAGIGEALALHMSEFVQSLYWKIDLLIPVPLGKRRLKERGYNQVGLVAEPLAYHVGRQYAPNALWESRETRSQVGLSISKRRENVFGAYQANTEIVKRKSVLLMDDVATTGSTIRSCTQALLDAGAREVYALTIARALSHHDLNRV